MNRLNRQLEYGLMALKILSSKRPGEKASAKEIAEVTGTPFDPMARVLQTLKQKEFLHGEQGAQGGYLLLKDLSQVSFYEFMVSLLGEMAVARCIHSKTDCELFSNCNIISPIHNFNKKLEEFYRSLSLQDLLLTSSDSSESVIKDSMGAAL